MKRIMYSDRKIAQAINWAMKIHSEEKGGEDSLTRKFFVAHFLSDFTEDKSVIRLCFLRGLLPSTIIEEDILVSLYPDEERALINDCILLKTIEKTELEELKNVIVNANERQSMIIAGYLADRLYAIEDSRKEHVSYEYAPHKAQLNTLIYSLFGKVPEKLFTHLEEKAQEIFFSNKELYFI